MNPFDPSLYFDLSQYSHKALFIDCEHAWEVFSKIEDYLQKALLQREWKGVVSSQAYIVNPETISIGEGSTIEAGAYIQGPCVIGKNCIVRHGAYMRGNVLTGDCCVIGHSTEVKNSIFFNHTHAAHFAYVGDSILGNNVNLGAGAKCANLKFDNSCITIRFGNQRYSTERRKLGAIVGDGAQLGCNSATNPGTFIGKGAILYPCTAYSGVAKKEEILKPKVLL